MESKRKLLLVLFLITWVLFGAVTFVNHSYQYIGKSYFASGDFESNIYDFKSGVGRYILQPFDVEKAIENITVSQEEIDQHRYYYGTLAEQIENIQMQYQDRITEAEVAGNTELKTQLEAERDGKIADIKENFNNDAHVEAKIRAQKEKTIKSYAAEEERNRKDFLNNYPYFEYSLINVETGETFESKNDNSSAVFKEHFGGQHPYLVAGGTVSIGEEYSHTYGENAVTIEPFVINDEVSQFEGTISIPKTAWNVSDLKNEYDAFIIGKVIFYVIWATAILAIVGLFTFAKPSLSLFTGFDGVKAVFNAWPIDVRIVIVFVIAMMGFGLIDVIGNMVWRIAYYNYNLVGNTIETMICMIMLFALFSSAIMGSIWIWECFNTEQKLKKEIKRAFLYRLADGMQDLFLNRSIGIQSLAILIVAFLAGFGFIVGMSGGDLFVIYILLVFFVGLPACFIFLRRMGYLNRIMKQTEEMAQGRLTTEIKVKGKGKSPFAKHAANVNALREGVRTSMSEQAKSERLKTELITNVSHDLRTPLTSIITYTDLLKNPDITEEERKQYIDVLDKKSARLKTLIEDLFEVSKMASGNIEITKQRVDLTQLLQQATGEHEEAFQNANLELRVTMPEEPIIAYVDGQKWWRAIDNLVVNALKYSMKGTRVYVSLKQKGSEAEFTVKNVSSYELSENVEELTERFKRADASRHTEGSGLGLAIAQSIVDLHNGRMNIEVDGDLFKVTVNVNMV